VLATPYMRWPFGTNGSFNLLFRQRTASLLDTDRNNNYVILLRLSPIDLFSLFPPRLGKPQKECGLIFMGLIIRAPSAMGCLRIAKHPSCMCRVLECNGNVFFFFLKHGGQIHAWQQLWCHNGAAGRLDDVQQSGMCDRKGSRHLVG